MLRAIAALALASTTAQSPTPQSPSTIPQSPAATAQSASTLTSGTPWWERVTVTVTDDGQARSCRYETSLQPNNGQDCSVTGNQEATAQSSGVGGKDQYTRLTFERRFSPGANPQTAAVQAGETLLGGRVMALAINAKGTVENCKVVSTAGSMAPEYGCHELAAERFDASAGGTRARTPAREGYMTILVYGHSEHVV